MIERSKSREKMPKPDARIETKSLFEIWEIEQLPEQEQLAMRNAIAAWANSNNPEFPAGSCAIAENGEMSVKHNHTNEPGKGQEGHAEMLAIRDLFESVQRAA